MTPAKKAIADALRAAKALIPDEAHWARSTDEAMAGRVTGRMYCPATAIGTATQADAITRNSRFNRATRAFKKAAGIPTSAKHGILGWNDMPERTLAEVHAAFDRAVAMVEGSE